MSTTNPAAETPVPTITRREYEAARRHEYAGPVSDLMPETRALPGWAHATHWRLAMTARGTTLCPVTVAS